jgi:ribosomal peptide maturation radical SAM protein 1
MNDDRAARVLLVTMPWATPIHPNLALGLLSEILNGAGEPTDCLYGNLLLPTSRTEAVFTITDPGQYEDRTAGLSFVPLLHPGVGIPEIVAAVAERHIDIVSREGQLTPNAGAVAASAVDPLLAAQTEEDVERARRCLERCLAVVAAPNYDVIGLSVTFETQLIASLALARRIKSAWPGKRVMLGGAACFSVQGEAIMDTYPFVDAVCTGEGDPAIVPMVRALRGRGPWEAAAGAVYRDGHCLRHSPPGEPFRDLDALPTPDYEPYFRQKRTSPWRSTLSVLTFETSRGCWWGQKHLCTFCGLNAETLSFRSKSPERVLDEIRQYQDRWDTSDGLQAVDNIFDVRYFTTLLPRLAAAQRERPVAIFFEIKSNLRLSHLFQLADAGIVSLQPGIESFSDHILTLMAKGADTFQQINFIKWATQVGIAVSYNLLLRNPGERVSDYAEMISIVPFLEHLPPPNGVANMQLERYSPYFSSPESFGIRNVRPKPHYRVMFPDAPARLDDIVYQFDFDHASLDAADLVAARRDFMAAVFRWTRRYQPGRLIYRVIGRHVVIRDERRSEVAADTLAGAAAEVFLYLDNAHSFRRIAQEFPRIAPDALRAFLSELVRRRFVYYQKSTDRYMSVVIRGYSGRAEYQRHRDATVTQAKRARFRPLPLAVVDPSRSTGALAAGGAVRS